MPSKKNIIPLLAIAFVVAIICTGVFYGLFAGKLRTSASAAPAPVLVVATRPLTRGTVLQAGDVHEAPWTTAVPAGSFTKAAELTGWMIVDPVKAGEPVTQARVASLKSGAGLAAVVPNGMRAVSVRTADSPGVTGILRPGYRVDVQYVGTRPNGGSNEPELRTVLQDVEVLAINPQQEMPNRAGLVVVTLLAKPEEADLLSLADANLRLRLVLRNPGDHDVARLGNVSVASLLHGSPVTLPAAPVAVPNVKLAANPAPGTLAPMIDERVALNVKMIGTDAAALNALGIPSADSLSIARLPLDVKVDEVASQWAADHQWDVLSDTKLMGGSGQPLSIQASSLELDLQPKLIGGGALRLRVQPRLQNAGPLVSSEVKLWAGQTVAIAGLPAGGPTPLIDRLFPLATSHRGQQLLILVTPRVFPRATASASNPRPQGE